LMATALELKQKGAMHRSKLELPQFAPKKLSLEALQLRERLLKKASEAASVLKSRFGARRVILFGSFAHHAWFRPDADMDIAVEGLPVCNFWEAWKTVEEIIPDRPVDLVDMETAITALKPSIRRYGIEL